METIKIAGVKREAFGKKESKSIRKQGAGSLRDLRQRRDRSLLGGRPFPETADLHAPVFPDRVRHRRQKGSGRHARGSVPSGDGPGTARRLLSCDSRQADLDRRAVKLTGNSEGVKQGGKLILSKRKVRISATMENLPDEIVVDVTTLGLGKSIFVGDLKYDHITILTPATTAICAVKMTRAAVAPPLQPKRPPRPRNSPEPHRFSYKYLAAEPPGNAARYFHLKQLRN